MVDMYLSALEALGKKGSTIQNYGYQLTKFFNWLQVTEGVSEASSITSLQIRAYVDALESEGMKPHSINTAISALDVFCSWMTAEGYMGENPVRFVARARDVQEPPRWLDRNERFRVIRAALLEENKRNTLIVLTFLLAGLRVHELTGLKRDDVLVTPNKGSVVIRTGKARVVPMCKDLRRHMTQYLQERSPGEWLFDSQRGERLTEKGVQTVCVEIGNKTNVSQLTPSVLRNTFAHDLVSCDVPLNHVAVLMGVSRVSHMQRYQTRGRCATDRRRLSCNRAD